MKKFIAALLIAIAPVAANAQSTKSTVVSAINVDFADNTAGAITAALLRTVTTQIVSSYVDWLTCTTQGGVVYWNGSAAPTCLIAGTAGQVLSTYPTPAWENLAGKITAGTGILVTGTITPTVSVSATIAAGGPTGSATVVPSITYNALGQLTAVSSNTISASTLLDVINSAQGSILYRGSTGWTALAANTSGYVFTTQGTSTNPGFVNPTGLISPTNGLAITGSPNSQLGLTNTIAAGGPTGSATVVPSITYDTTGRLTAVSTNTISASTLLDVISSTQGSVLYRGASGWAFLTPGTSGQVFTTGGAGANPSYTAVAGTGTVQSLTCGTGITCSTNPITVSGTLTPTFATGAQFMANNVTAVVDVGTPWSAANIITLSSTSVITPNFATGINFAAIITANTTIGNPTGQKTGQTGCLYLTQSGTTTGTVAYYNNWFFSGGTSPTASTAVNQMDALCYQVRSISTVVGSMLTNLGKTVPGQ